ncbi:hypothetical protein TNCV_2685781 [Trichonephila clavipes]|nr:hypothetical protein TNCV_2685781 [Trichonephila clavipes]
MEDFPAEVIPALTLLGILSSSFWMMDNNILFNSTSKRHVSSFADFERLMHPLIQRPNSSQRFSMMDPMKAILDGLSPHPYCGHINSYWT